MLAVASVPPVYAFSQLDEGICVFLALGKLSYGEAFSSFVERRPAKFSSHLKFHQNVTHE
jgi:hypothetical protein